MGKRQKDPTRERSLDLLYFWYRNRVRDGNQRYDPSGKELTITALPSESQGSGPRTSTKKLTANCKSTHTRTDCRGDHPYGAATDPLSRFGPYGEQGHKAYEKYAKDCLLAVVNVHVDHYRALEMFSAGYDRDKIAEELSTPKQPCSVERGKRHVECGIAAISMYQQQVTP